MSSSSFFLKYTEHISAQRHWLSDLDVDLGQASEVVHPRENMGRQCEQMKLGEAEGVCTAVGHRCSTVRIAAPPHLARGCFHRLPPSVWESFGLHRRKARSDPRSSPKGMFIPWECSVVQWGMAQTTWVPCPCLQLRGASPAGWGS